MYSKKQHLLGHALNELLANDLIDLNDTIDTHGYHWCVIAGKLSMINWNGIGCGEIRLSLWWDYDPFNHPQLDDERYRCDIPIAKRSKRARFVGAIAGCFVERMEGKYLQITKNRCHKFKYLRSTTKPELEAIEDCTPNGFNLSGAIH